MSNKTLNGSLVWVLALLLCATARGEDPRVATSSRQARQAAVKSIPYNQLTVPTRKKISDVVKSPSLYRRLPVQMVDCDSDLYIFLVRYPEIIVNMWRLMDATKVNLQRKGAYQLSATDGAGTQCDVELLYGNKQQHIYYAEGSYKGSLFRNTIKGRCVIILTSGFVQREGRSFVTHRLDYFVKIDNLGAEIVAKTLSPLVSNAADSNFEQTSKFVAQVSTASLHNPAGVQRLSHRLTQVQPPIRDYFAQLAFAISQRNKRRVQATVNGKPVSPAAAETTLLPQQNRRGAPNMRW